MDLDFDTQWQFEPSHFQHTPSRDLDGLSAQKELQERNDGIHFMLRCGNALKLKSNVLSCAATYFHRFYMRHSIGPNGYDKLYTAITCLFLASKVEESTRKLKDVAQVCYLKKYPKADPNNMQEADKWQDRIQTFEPIVLEALCFDLSVSHPHEYLAEAFSGGTRDAHTWEWKGRLANFSMIPRGLYQLAWSVVNDSLRIPLCLFYRPNLIASAAYLIAYTVIEGTQTTASNLSQSSSFSQAEVLTPPDEDGRGVSAAGSNLTTGELSEGIANTIHQQSNDEHIVTDSTSGGNMTDDVPIQTPTVILDMDVLISTLVAGPWIQAFSIEEMDLKDLRGKAQSETPSC
ncbi:hypothetical protein FRB95_011794 [Tulasnella sp. JGI-2019a]|nr:hypothetical protein FRB95_011794 [Tulasnella sp. JGI-2019a]